jgi:hypothetical protein
LQLAVVIIRELLALMRRLLVLRSVLLANVFQLFVQLISLLFAEILGCEQFAVTGFQVLVRSLVLSLSAFAIAVKTLLDDTIHINRAEGLTVVVTSGLRGSGLRGSGGGSGSSVGSGSGSSVGSVCSGCGISGISGSGIIAIKARNLRSGQIQGQFTEHG